MSTLKLLPIRGKNIFAAGHNLGDVLESAKVPVNQDGYEDFAPAAANGTIDIAVAADALELTFKTKGIQPELLSLCNKGYGYRDRFTLLGALVDEYADETNSRIIPVQATVVGRLNAEIGESEAKNVTGTEYSVKSIKKYTLRIGGTEICRFDLQRGGWLDAGGQRAEIAQIIGKVG